MPAPDPTPDRAPARDTAHRRRRLALAFAAGLALPCIAAHAQTGTSQPGTSQPDTSQAGTSQAEAGQPEAAPPAQSAPDPYEGRPVRSVILRSKSGEPLDERAEHEARNNIRVAAGTPYRRSAADADARRLNRLGQFGTVDLYVQLLEGGAVDVIYELEQRPVIAAIQVAGNTRLADQEIAAQVDLPVGAPVDRFQIDRAARRIEDLYREKGYYLARVSVDEDLLEGSGIVVFNIREGERVRVTDIRFVGADGELTVDQRILRREVETETALIFIRKGQVDEAVLESDVAALIAKYRDLGYLDIRADYRLTFAPNGKEAIVEFLIAEGPVYRLRSVQVEIESSGRPAIFTDDQLAGLIDLKPGDVYGAEALDAAVRTVRDAYGQLGFVDAADSRFRTVERRERRDPNEPVVDLLLRVVEGERAKTGEIVIAGNTITKQNVVRRDIDLRPERPLDTVALDRSRRDLGRLRLFNPAQTRLTIQPPDPIEPEYRDILVEIEEQRTGEFNIGGAVSSDAGVLGRISLVQRNFDVADVPDSWGDFTSGRSFRGAGQTFRLEALPGDRVQVYTLGLTDPRINDSDYSLGGTVFYRTREYDVYDEQRLGLNASLGRRFGTRWNGALNVRAETIELSDIEEDRPVDVFDVEDRNLLTSLGFSLSRSTLNNIYRPTSGSRSRVAVEQAGALGGDFTFTRLSAEHRAFFVVREDYLGRSTTLSAAVEVGYIPQQRDDTPTYERFYLGGQSFRGFDFRTVSPKGIRNDTGEPSDDPVGGNWLFFAGLELNQPIFEDVFALVLFVDSGTVTFDPGFEDYRVSVGFGIRFYVPQLSPAPLAFDFGFPIVSEEEDESRLFSFSLDLPF